MRRTTTAILIGMGLLTLAPLTTTAYKAYAADAAHGASCAGDQTEGATACNVNGCFVCTSGSWVTQPLYIGTSSLTCDSSHAGLMRYNSGAFEYCNGTSWTQPGSSCSYTHSSQIFEATGTWTPPSVASVSCPVTVRVLLVGGGGGGGGYYYQSPTYINGGGGGGAGYIQTQTVTITSTAGIAVTIGTGGAGTAASQGTGASGASSAFGNVIVSGGNGGNSANGNFYGGSGGSGGGQGWAYYSSTTYDGSNGYSNGEGSGQGTLFFGYTAGYTNAVLKLVYNSATFS